MPFNTSTGVYTPVAGSETAVAGQVVQSAVWNNIFTDIADSLDQIGTKLIPPPSTNTAGPYTYYGNPTGNTSTFTNTSILVLIPDGTNTSKIASIGFTTDQVGFFAASGNAAPLFAYLNNNLPTATNALPSAITAFADLPNTGNTGNQAFALYSLGTTEAATGTIIGAELTVRNFAGSPDGNLPPNESIGTTTIVPNALQVTCGGNFGSSIGVLIGSEAGSSQVFQTGIYLKTSSHNQYGIFIEAQNTGTPTSIVAKNNGNGINLQLQTTSSSIAANAVMVVANSASVTELAIKQNGDVNTNGTFRALGATNTVSGGSTTPAVQIGSAQQLGIYFGSGVPTITANTGSLYMRVDGTNSATRMYVNTGGSTGWAALLATG